MIWEDKLNIFKTEMNRDDLKFPLKTPVFGVKNVNGDKYPVEADRELFSMMNIYIQIPLKREWFLFNFLFQFTTLH